MRASHPTIKVLSKFVVGHDAHIVPKISADFFAAPAGEVGSAACAEVGGVKQV